MEGWCSARSDMLNVLGGFYQATTCEDGLIYIYPGVKIAESVGAALSFERC